MNFLANPQFLSEDTPRFFVNCASDYKSIIGDGSGLHTLESCDTTKSPQHLTFLSCFPAVIPWFELPTGQTLEWKLKDMAYQCRHLKRWGLFYPDRSLSSRPVSNHSENQYKITTYYTFITVQCLYTLLALVSICYAPNMTEASLYEANTKITKCNWLTFRQ